MDRRRNWARTTIVSERPPSAHAGGAPVLPEARLVQFPDSPRRPLDGIRVLDLTSAVAGPVATQLLGALGAEIIRIETPWAKPRNPTSALKKRTEGPDEPWNREPRQNELANSKRSVALNLTTDPGRETFLDLVEVSDVVLENFSPRVMGNFGLEWDTLSERNPQIVYVAMPAFGKSGPWRDRISYGPGIDAMSGLSWLTGYADGSPLKPGNFYCDQNAGVLAALSTVAALKARCRVGGQTVELAMLEGELQLIGEAMVGQQLSGREPTRIGNEHTSAAPHGVYPAAPMLDNPDSWIAIACRDDAEWTSLLSVWRDDAVGADRRFSSGLRRWKHRAELDDLLRGWTACQDPQTLSERLQRAGVPASPVMGPRALLRDEQVLARQSVGGLQHPQVGLSPAPQAAFRLSHTPAPPKNAAPLFAADTIPVLREILGYSEEQIADLLDSGAASDRLQERP
ncbi:MAG: CoA transferase [Chloroflexi bacterium]|nr:CoA transferase [Chloroflexota bacterium]MYD16055.1 CoA transferase [Chloroflexota bacterium]